MNIGPHRLLNADITTGAVAELMSGELADVIYSDPPWGPGNQQYWHTYNQRGSAPRTNWDDFLAAFCSVCRAHKTLEAPVFVEMGLRWAEQLDAAMALEGLPLQRMWAITYGHPARPNSLRLYGPQDVPVTFTKTHGPPVTATILGAVVKPGMVVLDPCCGLGMTARNTHKLGGKFRGCELNPKRLAVTADWLQKRTS